MEPKGDVTLVKDCRQQMNISSKAVLLPFSIWERIKQLVLKQGTFAPIYCAFSEKCQCTVACIFNAFDYSLIQEVSPEQELLENIPGAIQRYQKCK